MRSKATLAALVGLTLPLGACASVDPGFGEAVAYNKAVQTVNPDPQYPADGAKPGDRGDRGAKAAERYRKGETKPVQAIQTGGSSSSSGGGGQGPK